MFFINLFHGSSCLFITFPFFVSQLSFSLFLSPSLLSPSFFRFTSLLSLSSASPTCTLFLPSSSIACYPVALSAYRNSQSSLDFNAGREATTLFAATTVKGETTVCTNSPLTLIDHDACTDLRRASSPPISTEMKEKFHCSLVLLVFPCANSIKERDA